VEKLAADAIIYVTDSRQQDHFQPLFLTVERWFTAVGYSLPQMHHVWFGTVCSEDGKAIRTRAGNPIHLSRLFDEAISRADAVVATKNPDLDAEERAAIARAIGVGAIKYGDLSQNRTSDYIFSWDRMLAFDGNTAPYLQYAVARLNAIFRRIPAGLWPLPPKCAVDGITVEERPLARKMLYFPIALRQATIDLRPHILCTYLYELAAEFSTFYNACKVICDDPKTVQRRLLLCDRARTLLSIGLRLLGITPLDRM
jgi:arginyl-tRNA synthetase